MAFMNQERKAKLAPAIKAVLKKYGVKGSISVDNYSALVVTLSEGPIAFVPNLKQAGRSDTTRDWKYHQVNEYWFHEQYTGKAKQMLTELFAAMKGDDWFDHSDSQTDYFHIAYYTNVNVGKWNKPYVHTA